MLLRMLLVLVAVCGLSLSGCAKEEPTNDDVMDQMKQNAEDMADDARDVADDMADTAKEAGDRLAEETE